MRRGVVATRKPCHARGLLLGNCSTLLSDRTALGRQHGGPGVSDWTTIDYFNDQSLVEDPYAYFGDLRGQCPVLPLPHLGVVAVSGYEEANHVYHDVASFS